MATEQASPTPESKEATPAAPEPSTDTGTTQTSTGDAKTQGAPVEEGFTHVDPNTLPPELRSVHDNMLRDYKSKTAKLAEERREAQSVMEKSKLYDQALEDLEAKNKAKPEEQTGFNLSDEEYQRAFESKESFLGLLGKHTDYQMAQMKTELGQARKQLQVSEASEIVNAYAAETGDDGKPIRPDFDMLEKFGFIRQNLQDDPPKTVKQYEVKLEKAYQKARTLYSQIRGEGKTEALGTIQKKVQTSSEAPTVSAGQGYSGVDNKKISVSDAVAFAKKGIKVDQNW